MADKRKYDGPDWVKPGQMIPLMEDKAFIFREVWDQFENGLTPSKPYNVEQLAWDDIKDNLFDDTATNKARVKALKDILKYDLDPLSCSELDILKVLINLIKNSDMSKKSTVQKLCTNLRMAFRAIGREHQWKQGEVIKKRHGEILVDTSNPVSEAVSKRIVNGIKEGKLKKVLEKDVDPSAPYEKYANPVSLPVAHATMLSMIKELLSVTGPNSTISDFKRIVNTGMLALSLCVTMHEASRPVELFKNNKKPDANVLLHKDLFFPLHRRVYFMTLVFLNPKTLNYIISNRILTNYVKNMYKAKKLQLYRPTLGNCIPYPYNCLDLVTIYTLVFRCLITRGFDIFETPWIFPNRNYNDLLRTNLLKKFITYFTYYSIRYGAAIDDERSLEVDEAWTRYRMGHTKTSEVKNEYAKVKNKHVMIEDIPLKISTDFDETEKVDMIPLKYKPVENSLIMDYKFLERLPEGEIRNDFETTAMLVSNFIENGCHIARNLLTKKAKDMCTFQEMVIEAIPFGMQVTCPPEYLGGSLQHELDTTVSSIKSILYSVKDDKLPTPEIWKWPVLMYGDWSALLKERKQQNTKKRQYTEIVVSKWECNQIKSGDFLCIHASDKDKWALKLPNLNVYVWYAKATRDFENDLEAQFYYNKSKNITKKLSFDRTVLNMKLKDVNIVYIFKSETSNGVLDNDKVADIENYLTQNK
jgi:hypothetical protein